MIARFITSYFGMSLIAVVILSEAKLNSRLDAPWGLITSLLWAPIIAGAATALGAIVAQIIFGTNLKRRSSL